MNPHPNEHAHTRARACAHTRGHTRTPTESTPGAGGIQAFFGRFHNTTTVSILADIDFTSDIVTEIRRRALHITRGDFH